MVPLDQLTFSSTLNKPLIEDLYGNIYGVNVTFLGVQEPNIRTRINAVNIDFIKLKLFLKNRFILHY